MLPDLNRLKIFSLVYLNKSVSGAARELHISQPAVSQHLKKLERELKIPLFTRTNKKMIPTPAAARLYELIAPFITELQNEVKYLRRPLDTPYGKLRIGAPPIFANHYLPIICNHFRFRFPTVTFKLEQGSKEKMLPKISQGNLDFAIVEQSKQSKTIKQINTLYYTSKKLIEEELILACSRSYYQRKAVGHSDYEALKNLEYISSEKQNVTINQWFQHHFRKIPLDLNCVMSSDDHQSAINGIRCGMGLGITPYHIVKKEVEAGTIVIINTGKKQMHHTLSLIQLKNKKLSLTEKSFISVLIKELEKSKIGNSSIPVSTTSAPL